MLEQLDLFSSVVSGEKPKQSDFNKLLKERKLVPPSIIEIEVSQPQHESILTTESVATTETVVKVESIIENNDTAVPAVRVKTEGIIAGRRYRVGRDRYRRSSGGACHHVTPVAHKLAGPLGK